jgi:hypothetical protein
MCLAVLVLLAAEKPKEDRSHKLAKPFDALDTPDLDAHAKARNALHLAIGKGDLDAEAKGATDKRPLVRAEAIWLLATFKGAARATSHRRICVSACWRASTASRRS